MCSFCIIRYKLERESQYESNDIWISKSWRLGLKITVYFRYTEGNFGHHCIEDVNMLIKYFHISLCKIFEWLKSIIQSCAVYKDASGIFYCTFRYTPNRWRLQCLVMPSVEVVHKSVPNILIHIRKPDCWGLIILFWTEKARWRRFVGLVRVVESGVFAYKRLWNSILLLSGTDQDIYRIPFVGTIMNIV